jgi:3-deoxy-7-phosphoheptulonate synthase
VEIGDVRLGEDPLVVIAGPCAVESWDQIMATAQAVKAHGGQILRGGTFKPRTSPYSFQGLGWEGLEMLEQAGKAFGLPIVTEVLSPDDVEGVAAKADVLQIGARNMQNFTLLSAVGRTHRPVMLKRGMSASIDEWLQAAEYILAEGNQQVFLCERGIRTFETSTRNTLDLSAVPVLQHRSHLPVVVDPSHAAGDRGLVAPLAHAAAAIGASGVMVEVHPEPEAALSDGPQSLTFEGFERLMGSLGVK